MAELVWTYESRLWLREIRDYIAKDNSAAADRTVAGIYDKAQILKTFPELGFKYPVLGRDDVRVLVYGHYRIAYVFDRSDVTVLGVFHAALDMDKFFPKLD